MSEEPKPREGDFNPFALIALFAGLASMVIAVVAFLCLHTITDSAMWAIAAMVAAPAAMGIGVAYFLSRRPLA
jgi:hypothetical protein